jgi:preprotein translocase subunit SecE
MSFKFVLIVAIIATAFIYQVAVVISPLIEKLAY